MTLKVAVPRPEAGGSCKRGVSRGCRETIVVNTAMEERGTKTVSEV